MEYVMFFYNIFNILLYGICTCGFLLLFRRGGARRDLWIALMFVIFICDNLVFAMSEFIPHFMDFYRQMMAIAPYLSNLVTIAMVYSYRMVLAHMLDDRPGTNERLIHIAVFVLLFLLTSMASSWVGRLIYLIINHSAVAAVFIRGFVVLRRRRDCWEPLVWRRMSWLLSVSAVLHVGGAAERAYVRLILDQPADRSLCYEVFGLLCVGAALWYLVRQMESPRPRALSEEELLRLFVVHYHLTAREAELLPMLLSGADNAAIGEKHFISLNTVKVHTHNIYQKLGVERRGQLSQCMAEFKRSHES